MKKICKAFIIAVSAFLTLGLAGCKDAIVNDGTTVKSYISNTGGAGGAVPFHMFEGCDLQIWQGFTASINSEALVISLTGTEWWGGAFVNKGSVGPNDSGVVTYDMSKVSKISFEAMASENISMGVSTSSPSAAVDESNDFNITTDWDTYEFKLSDLNNGAGTDKDYGVFVIRYGASKVGVTISIKNISYFDASGNEIVPGVNK